MGSSSRFAKAENKKGAPTREVEIYGGPKFGPNNPNGLKAGHTAWTGSISPEHGFMLRHREYRKDDPDKPGESA